MPLFDLPVTIRSLLSASSMNGHARAVQANERMDLYSGSPYWLVRNGMPHHYPLLREDLRTDVAIVGGGITGALCAYILSKAGIPAMVLDARTIGTGSTCASTALLQYEMDTPLHELMQLVGERNAVRSYQLCARAVDKLGDLAKEIGLEDFTRRSSVQFASHRSHVAGLAKEYAARRANGLPVEFLKGSVDVRSVLPFDAPAALYTETAAETDALRFTHALHARSIANGTKVFQCTEVVEFRSNGAGIELRATNGCLVRAKYLVYATGYESRDLLPRDVIQLHSTYALVSEAHTAHDPWPENSLIWETASPYLYLRKAPEGRIMIGGRDEPFRDPLLRDALLARKTTALVQDFERLFPDISLRREFAWCGTFGSTKDGLPYIDQGPRDAHSFYALGMGGNGITFSLIAAEIIRDRILGRPDPDSGLFRFDR